jgi:hypothetical protein
VTPMMVVTRNTALRPSATDLNVGEKAY